MQDTPLLRVFWPKHLLPTIHQADRAPLELLGSRSDGHAVQEVVITGTRPLAAGPPVDDTSVVGTLLQQPLANVANSGLSRTHPCFMLLPTAEPGTLLPILLPAMATWPAATGPATRRRRQQAAEQQQMQQCQVVLCDGAAPCDSEDCAGQGQQQGAAVRVRLHGASRQQMAASLASHLAGALLAALLLAHWHRLTAAAVQRSTQLAGFVSGLLMWSASAQPAGKVVAQRSR